MKYMADERVTPGKTSVGNVMLEVDYLKAIGKGKGVSRKDKNLYKKRKKDGFGGLITSSRLIEEFS